MSRLTVGSIPVSSIRGQRVADSILVCVKEDAVRVVVPGTAVRLESEDVFANGFVEGEVGGFG